MASPWATSLLGGALLIYTRSRKVSAVAVYYITGCQPPLDNADEKSPLLEPEFKAPRRLAACSRGVLSSLEEYMNLGHLVRTSVLP
jgi:hypothetical protein